MYWLFNWLLRLVKEFQYPNRSRSRSDDDTILYKVIANVETVLNAGGGNVEEWFSQAMNQIASNILDIDDIGEKFMAENGSVQPEIVIQDDTIYHMVLFLLMLTPISMIAPLW